MIEEIISKDKRGKEEIEKCWSKGTNFPFCRMSESWRTAI
jgi:hypothetical protein